MQVIPRLPASHADYLASFNCRAIAISPTGYVYTSANPGGASAAWWTHYDDCIRLARAAQASGDVEAVAKRLKIPLTTHEAAVERVAARTARLDEALQRAHDAGLMKNFHATYRQRRLAAQQNGARYMTFDAAQRRLRRAITEVVANGGELNRSIVDRALAL